VARALARRPRALNDRLWCARRVRCSMSSSLSTSTLRTVERLWEERMSAPKGTLSSSGVSMVEWPGFTATVILDIGGSLIVAGPAEAIALLRHLSPQQL